MKVYLLILAVAAAVTYVAVPLVRHLALVAGALTPVRALKRWLPFCKTNTGRKRKA